MGPLFGLSLYVVKTRFWGFPYSGPRGLSFLMYLNLGGTWPNEPFFMFFRAASLGEEAGELGFGGCLRRVSRRWSAWRLSMYSMPKSSIIKQKRIGRHLWRQRPGLVGHW